MSTCKTVRREALVSQRAAKEAQREVFQANRLAKGAIDVVLRARGQSIEPEARARAEQALATAQKASDDYFHKANDAMNKIRHRDESCPAMPKTPALKSGDAS